MQIGKVFSMQKSLIKIKKKLTNDIIFDEIVHQREAAEVKMKSR